MSRRGYKSPRRYTQQELLEAEIADLAVDIRCTRRDQPAGWEEYVAKLESQMAELKTRRPPDGEVRA